jgi:hypothetical protein
MEQLTWKIISDEERDDEGFPLYWNTTGGWTSCEWADGFTEVETICRRLPIGGRWIPMRPDVHTLEGAK